VILLLGREFQTISGCVDRGDGKVLVRAGSGCSLGRFSLNCMEKGLSGLEFAGGIPGSVGGAVIMNAGAWGEDISSIVDSITLISGDGEKTLKREDLHFEYRCWKEYSDISGGSVISEVAFLLTREDSGKIRARCRLLQEKRRKIQPNSFANAGSFFKNPDNDSAGRLIEASGFKGVRVGDAMVSKKHANFLVNCGNATAGDVLTLMSRIQKKVKEDSGVELQPEVHFI
jgi:UDP-N-acetylmuramate dehydrogenase